MKKVNSEFLEILGFKPKNGAVGVYAKEYSQHLNYGIEVDLTKESINYGNLISADCKTTQNFSQDENWVVLECVDRLLEKGYKPQNIVLEKTWAAGHGTSGRLDICVNNDDGSEYLLIECKTFGREFDKELNKMCKDGGQLFTYFKFSNKADILMLYTSKIEKNKIVYQNEIVKIEDEYRTGDVKDFYEKWNKLPKDNGIFDSWVQPYCFESKALIKSQLKPINQDDSSFIFNRFLEILRHNVVSDKGNAFNKIFTLFLCKVYDETSKNDDDELDFQWKEGVDDDVSFQLRLTDLYKSGMLKFLSREVSDFNKQEFDNKYNYLDDNIKKELLEQINRLRLEKNNEFAIKEVYDHDSFVENAKIVKEVVELLQGYRIRYNKRQQYLSDFFELLLTTGLKQEAGQFFTPVPIAQFIIKSLPLDKIVDEKLKSKDGNILPYMIDYAAGSGHFITEYMHEVQNIIDKKNPSKYIERTKKEINYWQNANYEWATDYVYGVEKDYRLVKVGKVGCYLHGDGLANVILSDGLGSFAKTKDYKEKLHKDIEDNSKDNQQFDILLSNPPYSVQAFRNTTRDYYTEKDFDLYNNLTDNSSEIECLFVERTKQLLKDGGIASIILPSSILTNSGIYTKTREFLLKYFEITAITELGSNTFMATGTNTVVLFLKRRNNYECLNLQKAVDKFFAAYTDVTINNIETPITKYVNYVWENLSFDDYLTLLNKQPNDKVKNHEIYKEYSQKITTKSEKEFWNKVLELEKEKIYYFILAYPQKLVVIKTGEKEAEKQFLGYEFSNRRGAEGIHAIQRDKSIDECTKLFDINTFDNPKKASTYIYKAFLNEDIEIDETLKDNISRVDLLDMMTFDRVDFEKVINVKSKKKLKIESKWKTKFIKEIVSTLESGSRPSGGVKN
ncbi:MAG: N-6 DNA methylase, partial [Candidatus Gastranaerophilales bacterium]|nr:N-6 DNA methylase [Candidatus Gastranaerophilales bacterium]